MNDAKGALKIGDIINDKWVVLELIGKGGMGEVYRAHQINLKRDVAVKVISKEWISCIGDDDEEVETALNRFEREVHAMAGIRHPNVLQIYDYGSDVIDEKEEESRTIQYIVMEYIPGNTLRATMSELGFDPEEDLTRQWLKNYFFPFMDGMEAIHKADMVHRDVKPENVLMDDQIPKMADFGLARSCRWKAMTRSVDFKGTVMYMPPEQFMDFRHTDVRGDIYSLGKILYEAIVGKISSKDKAAHFKTVGLDKPESPFFEEMDRIIRKATAEDPDDRFQSVKELREALIPALSIPENAGSSELNEKDSPGLGVFQNPKWIWFGISVAVLSMGLMTLWHIFFQNRSRNISEKPKAPVSSTFGAASRDRVDPVITKDGATMLFIPGGELSGLGSDKDGDEIAPFYMDETPVTNVQYVEFLNGVLPEISVQNGVILGEGFIWLILGEVMEGYEPILFRDGKFMVSHSGHAACPVLRVTAYGAQAYARIYNKRLLSRSEWMFAYQAGKIETDYGKDNESAFFPIPTPVILFDKNRFGIRGLNQSINEWVEISPKESPSGPEFMVLGNIADEVRQTDGLASVKRHPWEAFDRVGFRCARDFPPNEKGNGDDGTG